MKELSKFAVKLSLALGVLSTGLIVPGCGNATPAKVISTMDQGMHEIRIANGRLVLAIGTYQDMQAYKRSVTAYFIGNKSKEWYHVPIVESEGGHWMQWFHISQGETTEADATIVTNGSRVSLVIVKQVQGKNKFKITRYLFREGNEENPFEPAYVFAPVSSKTITGKPSDSVETLLDIESKRQ